MELEGHMACSKSQGFREEGKQPDLESDCGGLLPKPGRLMKKRHQSAWTGVSISHSSVWDIMKPVFLFITQRDPKPSSQAHPGLMFHGAFPACLPSPESFLFHIAKCFCQ